MTITIKWIQNETGAEVRIEKGDGKEIRLQSGERGDQRWEMPMWRSGQRMIINKSHPRVWFVDRDNAILVSTNEGSTWDHYMTIKGGASYGMVIRSNGVAIQNP
ncbi:unnamed protein product [Rotaria socialis]|uniref:Photosynthesis system II assembly factor Ycf48/Hcf136-like domain-containing protein n=1 Tax=Rotaria socialis TaxID=392032 RepID=A0A818AZA3_9BILA|nr:unnamed protein product [Rotaria socialis]CAF4665534.1 unnamed protein product [Rotaria socialis]